MPSGVITLQDLQVLKEQFHSKHFQKFTFKLDQPTEFVNYHVTAIGKVSNLKFSESTCFFVVVFKI